MSCQSTPLEKPSSANELDQVDLSASLSKNKLLRTLQYGVRTIFDPFAAAFGWWHILGSWPRVVLRHSRQHYIEQLRQKNCSCAPVYHDGGEALCQMCGYTMMEVEAVVNAQSWHVQTCSKLFFERHGSVEQYKKCVSVQSWEAAGAALRTVDESTDAAQPEATTLATSAGRPGR